MQASPKSYFVASFQAAQKLTRPSFRTGALNADRRSRHLFDCRMLLNFRDGLQFLCDNGLGQGGRRKAFRSCSAPSFNIHFNKSVMAFFFAGSAILSGTRSHVKLEIGYESLPGALVMETRKSSGISLIAPAAAARDSSQAGLYENPGGFFTLAYDMLFWTARSIRYTRGNRASA